MMNVANFEDSFRDDPQLIDRYQKRKFYYQKLIQDTSEEFAVLEIKVDMF